MRLSILLLSLGLTACYNLDEVHVFGTTDWADTCEDGGVECQPIGCVLHPDAGDPESCDAGVD